MRTHLILAGLVLALAGCEKPEEAARNMSVKEVAEELSAMKIEPGQWEATNEIVSASGAGLPPEALAQMKGHKTTVSNCITPEQAAQPNANFLAAQQNSDCTYQGFEMRGGKMSGTMSCEGGEMPGKMVMKMSGTYGPRSYDMTMDMTTGGPAGEAMTIKARTVGKRTGQCA